LKRGTGGGWRRSVEEVLPRIKEQRNILHEIIKWKADWIVTFCVEVVSYSMLFKER
jgi:hypothetical protein